MTLHDHFAITFVHDQLKGNDENQNFTMYWRANARPQPSGNQLKNPNSFVKYENPSIVSEQADSAVTAAITESKSARKKKRCSRPSTGNGMSGMEESCPSRMSDPYRFEEREPGERANGTGQSLAEILNTILPPVIWQEDGKTWKQVAAITPGSELDVASLKTKLNERMKERGAFEYGICPVRHDLYRECFNELIRQMTVTCGERGLLLSRVRDELDNTIDACRDIYRSATAFAMRRRLQLDAKRAADVDKYNEVLSERDDLIHEQQALRERLEDLERQTREESEADESKHAIDIEVLKRVNQQVKNQLVHAIAPGYLQTATARPSLAQVRRLV